MSAFLKQLEEKEKALQHALKRAEMIPQHRSKGKRMLYALKKWIKAV